LNPHVRQIESLVFPCSEDFFGVSLQCYFTPLELRDAPPPMCDVFFIVVEAPPLLLPSPPRNLPPLSHPQLSCGDPPSRDFWELFHFGADPHWILPLRLFPFFSAFYAFPKSRLARFSPWQSFYRFFRSSLAFLFTVPLSNKLHYCNNLPSPPLFFPLSPSARQVQTFRR